MMKWRKEEDCYELRVAGDGLWVEGTKTGILEGWNDGKMGKG
jgi:hypothetical protein